MMKLALVIPPMAVPPPVAVTAVVVIPAVKSSWRSWSRQVAPLLAVMVMTAMMIMLNAARRTRGQGACIILVERGSGSTRRVEEQVNTT